VILIVTCEHGGNEIPDHYKFVFNNAEDVLKTHRGYDLGALSVFKHLEELAQYSYYSNTSRLLIELNRSLHHNHLFSEFTKPLKLEYKKDIISNYYLPYRNAVESEILKHTKENQQVVHLSIHTFTPQLNDIERSCDIGLLFDSKRPDERQLSEVLKKQLHTIHPNYNVRFNYPYLGKADGFTTYLRKQFKTNYIGIEIEINQKFSKNNTINKAIKETLFLAIDDSCKTKKRH
jgi:predicted N-formylglutamate amidohydrolase